MEQEQLQVKTPEYVSLQFQTAGLGSRATAAIIDYSILYFFQFLLFLLLFFVMIDPMISSDMSSWIFVFMIILLFVINFGYFIFSEYFWAGRTVGKRLLGIRVIQENGHRITFLSSIIRNFMRLIDSLPTAYLIGILLVFLHSKHKRLGDITAGTIVIHEHQRKKHNKVDKFIQEKGWSKEQLSIDHYQRQKIDYHDWQLLQTYCQRLITLSLDQKESLTQQVGRILLPKINREPDQLPIDQQEAMLFILYLHLREEWEY
ncbi:RDD domain containing protein [Gracilibacillus halophilus YIM-C55.5]|uniref:RDD domain containing protein n=1 Tax=Gracilibacillus halophilus YIM-C55.5 TaxID=1308866 RepID=N4WPP4_9BACI|nr:RDD family protein [Gracilibacillus halophilus]ENH96440.1 RDD domain containing protein [Gracilibacillus halophilus YIM-C55.5]